MDLAPLFNDCLKRRDVAPIKRHKFNEHDLEGFLREAYTLNNHISELTSYLQSIRAPYLSTAHLQRRKPTRPELPQTAASNHTDRRSFTNKDREEIDAGAKRSIRELNARITELATASQAEQDTGRLQTQKKRAKNGLGVLGRWAAGGGMTAKSPEEQEEDSRMEALSMHREGIIWYLKRKLAEATAIQGEMMEIRITREVEKSKSVLYKSRPMATLVDGDLRGVNQASMRGERSYGGAQAAVLQDMDQTGESQVTLTEEQMQLFAQENQDMLKHYEDTLDQVRSAEKSLMEISELQTTLAQNLSEQSEQIDVLVQNSYLTAENVGSGNKQLKKATERKSTARLTFYATIAFCSFLVVWDLAI